MPELTDVPAHADSRIAVAARFMQVVWNGRDSRAVFDLVTEDYLDHAYVPSDARGHAAMVDRFNAAFSETRHEIEHAVAQSDLVILRLRVHARHTGVFRGIAPTGALIKVAQYRTFRIRHDVVSEHWALFDTMSLMQQLNALPDPGLACPRG